MRHAVEEADEGAAEGRAATAPGDRQVHGPLQEPLRPAARRTTTQLRGRRSRGSSAGTPTPRATASREQIEGYMREVPCPACGGARLKPASLGGHDRRQEHLRGRRAVDRRGGRVPRARSSCPSATGMIAERVVEGDQRAAAVPARRRARLPHAQPLGRHARRRRGAAHPARRRRSAAGSSACSTCSTSRRSGCTSATTSGSSTRSSACATSATRCSSSSTTRRRSASPTTSSTSGRAPASTAARSSYAGTVKGLLKAKESITGQYLSGKRSIPVPGDAAPAGRRRGSSCAAPASTTCKNIDVEIPLGCFVAVTGVSGSGKSHARQRHPATGR